MLLGIWNYWMIHKEKLIESIVLSLVIFFSPLSFYFVNTTSYPAGDPMPCQGLPFFLWEDTAQTHFGPKTFENIICIGLMGRGISH